MSRQTVSRIALPIAAALILMIALFDIRIDPQFALPQERQARDPEQEARFNECFAQRDANIHETAFTTIDNPDVQREFISTQRDAARAECRTEFPQQTRTERLPFQFNLVDLRFRY